MTSPTNLLEGKTFSTKLLLIAKFLPVFSLTAFFRIGSGVVNVLNYHHHHHHQVVNVLNYVNGSFAPFRPIYSLILTWCATADADCCE